MFFLDIELDVCHYVLVVHYAESTSIFRVDRIFIK